LQAHGEPELSANAPAICTSLVREVVLPSALLQIDAQKAKTVRRLEAAAVDSVVVVSLDLHDLEPKGVAGGCAPASLAVQHLALLPVIRIQAYAFPA